MSAHRDEAAIRGHGGAPVCLMCDLPVHAHEVKRTRAPDWQRNGILANLCDECFVRALVVLVQYDGPQEQPVPDLDDDRDTLPAPVFLACGCSSYGRHEACCDVGQHHEELLHG